MTNNSLVIKAKRLVIGDLTKVNTFFYLLKRIWKWHGAFCQETLLMRQNLNNAVSKDSTIVWDTIGDTQMAGLHGLRNKLKFPKNRTN